MREAPSTVSKKVGEVYRRSRRFLVRQVLRLVGRFRFHFRSGVTGEVVGMLGRSPGWVS